jgi:hypothetical protein
MKSKTKSRRKSRTRRKRQRSQRSHRSHRTFRGLSQDTLHVPKRVDDWRIDTKIDDESVTIKWKPVDNDVDLGRMLKKFEYRKLVRNGGVEFIRNCARLLGLYARAARDQPQSTNPMLSLLNTFIFETFLDSEKIKAQLENVVYYDNNYSTQAQIQIEEMHQNAADDSMSTNFLTSITKVMQSLTINDRDSLRRVDTDWETELPKAAEMITKNKQHRPAGRPLAAAGRLQPAKLPRSRTRQHKPEMAMDGGRPGVCDDGAQGPRV